MGTIDHLYSKYGGSAKFLVIYTREEHPTEGANKPAAWTHAPEHRDPRDLKERRDTACMFVRTFHVRIPTMVDDMKDTVSTEYDGRPDRIFVVGPDSKLAYVGGIGPSGFRPEETAPVLDKMLKLQRSVP